MIHTSASAIRHLIVIRKSRWFATTARLWSPSIEFWPLSSGSTNILRGLTRYELVSALRDRRRYRYLLRRHRTKAHQNTFPMPSAIPSKSTRLFDARLQPAKYQSNYISIGCYANLLVDDCVRIIYNQSQATDLYMLIVFLSLPLDCRRRFSGNVVHDPIDTTHFVDDAVGHLAK